MPNWPRVILRAIQGRRLPVSSGVLEVSGTESEVTIRRDQYGIPYIEATNDLDAWYGLGFCHGQDRAFQMEMLLRLTRGTLSELVGSSGLAIDRLSRRIGFHHFAELQADSLESKDREVITAYCRGVWEGSSIGCDRVAHEFALLRSRPTPWGVSDVLASINYISFALSTWAAKLSRLLILQADGAEAVKALDGGYGEWLPVTRPAGAAAGRVIDRLGQDLLLLSATLGPGGASNNWAIHRRRSATGRPLLANDPHLAPTLPAPWYLAHVRTPSWSVAGASFVGMPVIAAGHNDTAAWGVTAGLADNLDLYLEQVDKDGVSVRQGNTFVPCDLRHEIIKIKGGEDVVEEILMTPRGPIISPALEGVPMAVSMKAVWHRPGLIHQFRHYHHARDFAEFRRAVLSSAFASLNMVYADTGDTIGWQLVGHVPKRNGANGTMPFAGWEEAHQWEPDMIPSDDMPYLRDPDVGFVATANNKPTADSESHYLGRDWAEGYRLARINMSLEAKEEWDVEACQALQMDQFAVAWSEMRNAVLEAPESSEEIGRALRLLREWDGNVASDSVGATVYQFFIAELVRRMVEIKAPNAVEWGMGKGFHPSIPRSFFAVNRVSQVVTLLREQPEDWLPLPWQDEMAAALERSIDRLKAAYSDDETRWAWGTVRPLTLLHPLGQRRPLQRIFNLGPFAVGGDGQTVAQVGRDFTDPSANPGVIANMRMVLDVGQWDENRFVLAGGQSGNPLSPHYADMVPLWLEGKGVTMAWSHEAIALAAKSKLTLVPC